MKQGAKDALKGGFITFLIFDIPLFLLGLWFNNKILVVNFDFTSVTPYIYIGIPLFGAIIFLVGGHLQSKRRNRYYMAVGNAPPLIPTTSLKIRHFDVDWKVIVGIEPDGHSYYVEGCYCPQCGCKLMTDTKNRYFGWVVKYIWKCSDNTCGFTISRPKDFLFEEYKAISNIVRREYEKGSG